MRRLCLATSVALPCLIAVGMSCFADDSVFTPGKSGGGGDPTTVTGGDVGGGPATTGGGIGGMPATTAGGMGGTDDALGMPCTMGGDCTAALKTRAGRPMDGWANVDPPRMVQPPNGIQGNSQVDDAAPAPGDQMCGSPCASTEGRADHGLPLKWASWQLMGPGIDMGTTYSVTIHIWGVVECKTYRNLQNCPRPVNAGRDAEYDMWCPGGTDPAATADHYNTYMLSVTPQRSGTTPNLGPNQGPMPTAGNWWMLNECPTGEQESRKTWMIDYEKTIPVPAGSWINFLDFDNDCREILNCGNSNDAAGVCNQHYMLTPSGAVPAPPSSIANQPASWGAGGFGQWIFFDVKDIVPM